MTRRHQTRGHAGCGIRASGSGVVGLGREDEGRPEPRDIRIETLDVRNAAAEDNHVRIEDVDDAGQRPGEPALIALQRRLGSLFTACGGSHNLHRLQALARDPFVVGSHTGTGEKRLDASPFTAIAHRSWQLTSLRPWKRVVPPLSRDAIRAVHHLTVDHDAAANAGAEDHAKDDRGAGGGAIGCL